MYQPPRRGNRPWQTPLSASAVPAIFSPSSAFHSKLKREVESYFTTTGKVRQDLPAMYLKSAVVLTWLAASYYLLVFHQNTALEAVLYSLSAGFAMAGIGFNVAHDACHGAYSARPGTNRLMALTLDMLGGSSYVWKFKHNYLHHNYTNVAGTDDDIDFGFVAHLEPHRPLRGLHRYQHLYLWPLYGLLVNSWQYYDFTRLIRGRVGARSMPRPKGLDLVITYGGKLVFFSLVFIVPMMLHPISSVLLCWTVASFAMGVTMAVVFQVAHCVEHASFPQPHGDRHEMDTEWAVHQIQTTVDFGRTSAFLTWYLGGLNFQVEHHLFPKICHLHYPALSGIVERICGEFGVNYKAHPSIFNAIASHYRFLRRDESPMHATS